MAGALMEEAEEDEGCVDLHRFHEVPTWARVLLTLLYSTLLVTGVVGNAVTVLVTVRRRRRAGLQSRVSYHMLSLAVSDLLVLAVGVPVELATVVWRPAGAGEAACKLHFFLWDACTYATLFNIAAFSAERYLAVCHPFRARAMTRSRTKAMLLAVWLLAVVSALPMLFAMGLEDAYEALRETARSRARASDCSAVLARHNGTALVCTSLRARETMLRATVYTCLAAFLVVLAAVAYMCREMVVRIEGLGAGEVSAKWEKGGGGGDRSSSSKKEDEQQQQRQQLGRQQEEDEKETRKEERKHRRVITGTKKAPRSKLDAAKRQSVLMLELVVLALAVCWLPFQATRIMSVVRSHGEWTVAYYRAFQITHRITDCFFFLSSTVNPALYCLSSPQFRHAFWQCLCCRFCKDAEENVAGGRTARTGAAAAAATGRSERGDSSHGITDSDSSTYATGGGVFARGLSIFTKTRWGRGKGRAAPAGALPVGGPGPPGAGPAEHTVQLVGSAATVDESSV
uniref:G-protein coupled receptor 39-like n=1 Tax=Petromyzon marinus TaxID=7757 RepID=A0AAJ7X4Q8_PETMA|nr:G-protein coupled receptor 39-like [Petromyzon marinus]